MHLVRLLAEQHSTLTSNHTVQDGCLGTFFILESGGHGAGLARVQANKEVHVCGRVGRWLCCRLGCRSLQHTRAFTWTVLLLCCASRFAGLQINESVLLCSVPLGVWLAPQDALSIRWQLLSTPGDRSLQPLNSSCNTISALLSCHTLLPQALVNNYVSLT